MKKFAGALLACIICLSAVFCTGVSAAEVKLGDVNSDGKISIKDATLVQMYVCGLVDLEDDLLVAADVDRNSHVNVSDATYIMKFIVHSIDEFPNKAETQPSTEKPSLSTDSEGYYNVVVKP